MGLLLLRTDGGPAAADRTDRLPAPPVLAGRAGPRRVGTWWGGVRLSEIRTSGGKGGVLEQTARGAPCASLTAPPPRPRRETPQLDAELGRLARALLQEGHRLKAWGVLGTGTGAELLRPGEPCSVSAGAPGTPGPECRVTGFHSQDSAEGEGRRTKPRGNARSWEGFPCSAWGRGVQVSEKKEPQKWQDQKRPKAPPSVTWSVR